jgi:hypothetical protein
MSQPEPRPTVPQPVLARAPRAVTGRAVVIALVLIALLAGAGFYIELYAYIGYDFNTQSPPLAPLGVVVAILLGNAVVARFRRGLGRRELLVIYAIVTVSAPLIAHGTLMFLLALSISHRDLAHTNPGWANAFFQYVPSWFCPTDPDAVEGFFYGQSSVPWALWRGPLLAWGLFAIALYLGNLCLLVIFRRQWIAHERLSFPIATVPLEGIGEDARGSARFSSHRAFWIGFAVVFVLGLQFRLTGIFPNLPALPLNDFVVIPAQRTGPLVGFGDFIISLWPTGIGLAYLIPKELSFSVWFFWYVRVIETVIGIACGVTPMQPQDYWGTEFPAPYYQGGGAVIALGILAFWSGRHYLRDAFRQAFRGREGEDDVAAPLGYRLALLGLLACMAYMIVFCMAAGSRLMVAVLLISMVLAYHMVWARLRAENGMSFIAFPYTVGSLFQEPLGTALLRPREIVTINALDWTYWPGWGEGCEVITGASLDALKISTSARIPQRPLLKAMLIGFLFALVIGFYILLTGTYARGYWNYSLIYQSWLLPVLRNTGQADYDGVVSPSHFSLLQTGYIAGGVVITFVLAALRVRFWWWPLHPVGFLAANVWGTQSWWCPMFIGWAVKSLVTRYGGLRLYQRTMPAAVGMILADRLLAFVWPLVVAMTR